MHQMILIFSEILSWYQNEKFCILNGNQSVFSGLDFLDQTEYREHKLALMYESHREYQLALFLDFPNIRPMVPQHSCPYEIISYREIDQSLFIGVKSHGVDHLHIHLTNSSHPSAKRAFLLIHPYGYIHFETQK
jgi:hypothetical protein